MIKTMNSCYLGKCDYGLPLRSRELFLIYTRSAASIPVYQYCDIKSTNILLDEKYRATISDFGSSRSIAIDQTHLTTHVQGTFGYLDLEYFQSSQFTEKSNVYSFGVVLVELLSGQKPIFSASPTESRSLTSLILNVNGSVRKSSSTCCEDWLSRSMRRHYHSLPFWNWKRLLQGRMVRG